nr:PREDICTED: mediator of RNA polymerase II transcription subunit 22 [Rhinolophus sinicus]
MAADRARTRRRYHELQTYSPSWTTEGERKKRELWEICMRPRRSRELAPARDFGFKATGLLLPETQVGALPRAGGGSVRPEGAWRRWRAPPGPGRRGRTGASRAPPLARSPVGPGQVPSGPGVRGPGADWWPQTSDPRAAQSPTMAQQRALPQSKETLLQSYNKRLKDDVKSIMDNFTEIIKTAKIEDETQVSRATQGEQDNYEMHVRAANIVRAGESLMKLVSDLKQFLILNDFPSVNEAIDQRNQQLRALQEECDRKLITLRDEISIDLYELEEEYYSSSSSLCEANDLPLCEAYWRLDLDTDTADGLSAPLLASPEPSAGPLPAAAPAHSHASGPGPSEHA